LPENLGDNEGYLSIKALSETFEVFLRQAARGTRFSTLTITNFRRNNGWERLEKVGGESTSGYGLRYGPGLALL
jgi:hypothetical protein